MGGIAAALPIIQAVTPLATTLLSSGGGQSSSAPPPPAPAPAPEAPQVEKVSEAAEDPIIDAEAARVRALKRRKAAEDDKLFNLEEESDAVIKTSSLLGE